MRKTVALFLLAALLLVTALFLGVRKPARIVPTPEPPSPARWQESGRDFVRFGDMVVTQASLSSAFVLADAAGSLSMLVDLEAVATGGEARPPAAVALVIDRSGSMAGEKIQKVRRAAKDLAARLDDGDRLSIVTYASDYAVDLPLTRLKGQRERIERVIDEILDGGGTNLAGGLRAGIDVLRTADGSAVRRLILLSDGNANQGLTDPVGIAEMGAEARQYGITVTTLGVGLDFNEDLMTALAQRAGGGYYYASDASSVAKALEAELDGLVRLVAHNVELGLELPPGFSIHEVYGYKTELRGGRVVIPVGDMAGGERRRVMVKLNTEGLPQGPVDVTGLIVSYTAVGSENAREHRDVLRAVATPEASQVSASERAHVIEAFRSAEAAEARKLAAARFKEGDRTAALHTLADQIRETKRVNARLKSQVLDTHVAEMESVIIKLNDYALDSEAGKDLVKREKLKARLVFSY